MRTTLTIVIVCETVPLLHEQLMISPGDVAMIMILGINND